MEFIISEKTISMIMAYLIKRPYIEVAELLATINNEIKDQNKK